MFVVTGASGRTGKIVAERLLDAGKRVRLFARDPERVRALQSRGAEVVTGSLEDFTAFGRALEGAEGLYLLSPPDVHARDFLRERAKLLDGVIDLIERAKVGHTVLLSSLGAELPEGTGPVLALHHAESGLEKTGLPVTFVRAGYFVENWGAVLPIARKDGVLPSFVRGDQPVPMLSTPDIGNVAADALLAGPRGTEIIELVGPKKVTPREVADTAARLLGHAVTLVEPPLSEVVPTFTSLGVSEDVARLYEHMFRAIARGELEPRGGAARLVRGAVPLEQTLRALLGA
jgi:uncharacterized protein YbjT (DUF2867 family)